MSHNSFIRIGGSWLTGTEILHEEMSALDQAQYKSINGDDGGIWAPASPIVVGGQGLNAQGPFSTGDDGSGHPVLTASGQFLFLKNTGSITVSPSSNINGAGGSFILTDGNPPTYNPPRAFNNVLCPYMGHVNGGSSYGVTGGTPTSFLGFPGFYRRTIDTGNPGNMIDFQLFLPIGATITGLGVYAFGEENPANNIVTFAFDLHELSNGVRPTGPVYTGTLSGDNQIGHVIDPQSPTSFIDMHFFNMATSFVVQSNRIYLMQFYSDNFAVVNFGPPYISGTMPFVGQY